MSIVSQTQLTSSKYNDIFGGGGGQPDFFRFFPMPILGIPRGDRKKSA